MVSEIRWSGGHDAERGGLSSWGSWYSRQALGFLGIGGGAVLGVEVWRSTARSQADVSGQRVS